MTGHAGRQRPSTQPACEGQIWSAVVDAAGRQYSTDQFNHRVIVEEPGGQTWTIGADGTGAGDLRFPRGLALVAGPTVRDTRLFVADSGNHRVQVFDGTGALRFGFGSYGESSGQFRAPADVLVACPELPWEGDRHNPEPAPVLVVADQWNARVQIFGLDGVWLTSLVAPRRRPAAERAGMSGWPFFRLDDPDIPSDPVRLSWSGQNLRITSADGRTARINLAAAMLPGFEEWDARVPAAERLHAGRYFGMAGDRCLALPADVLSFVPAQRAS